MNVGESLLHALRDHGAQQVFGIPGDFVLPFFKVVEESAILPLYTLSHEPSVGFAADAAARVACAPGVAAVTYGAGALNMVNPVAAAYAEKSPLVVISGAPGQRESRGGLLLHHQVKRLDSQFAIYREITCDQASLHDPASAPREIARVLHSCLTQSRPVYLELPRDVVFEPCAPVPRLPERDSTRKPSPPARTRSWSGCGAPRGRDDGRRRSAAIRPRGARGRARAPHARAGGHFVHGTRPARELRRAGRRHVPRPDRASRGRADPSRSPTACCCSA